MLVISKFTDKWISNRELIESYGIKACLFNPYYVFEDVDYNSKQLSDLMIDTTRVEVDDCSDIVGWGHWYIKDLILEESVFVKGNIEIYCAPTFTDALEMSKYVEDIFHYNPFLSLDDNIRRVR